MKAALAQINTTVGDVRGNRDRVLREMEKAESLGADLVIFPELCLTGYPPRDLLGLQGFVDSNIAAVHEIAARTGRTGVVLGFVDRNPREGGKDWHNAAALLSEGRILGVTHKMLLPTYDVFDEDRYFERGSANPPIRFRDCNVGLSICEDAWNAEDFWPKPLYGADPIRSQAEQGADLLINISASPFETDKPRVRYRMLLDHVRKHRVPLLYVNLVGGNDDILFDGNSLAFGAAGNLMAQGRNCEEDLLVVDTESAADEPYIQGTRTENLFRALVMGTRDYAVKCGFKSAVLGLSGGIDSAVVACIAAAALGSANVMGVAMPSAFSAPESREDACRLAGNLGIRFDVIPIGDVFLSYKDMLSRPFSGVPEDTTEENLQARIRGNILMALSNKFGHLVLSTGNKSELAVGYCTLYGDMAGGLAVISDVPKTTVYELAAWINRDREIVPANTIRRAPSAELRPDQTDQDSLPPYEVLDGILKLRVEGQLSVAEIVAAGFDPATVKEVVRMINRSEYKRRQAAPGLKVSPRAFGSGRRMPVAMRLSESGPGS